MKIPIHWLILIFVIYGLPIQAQDTSRKNEPYIVETSFSEKYIYTELTIHALTHTGDTVDLKHYINTHYEYPTWMYEAGIDGSMYYELKLDKKNHVDSLILLRAIYKGMDHHPLDSLFKSFASLLVPPGINVFDVRIRITLGDFIFHKSAEITPLIKRKRRKR